MRPPPREEGRIINDEIIIIMCFTLSVNQSIFYSKIFHHVLLTMCCCI